MPDEAEAAPAAAATPAASARERARIIVRPPSLGPVRATAFGQRHEQGRQTGDGAPERRDEWRDDVGPDHHVTEHDRDADGADCRRDLVVGEVHGSLPEVDGAL